MLATLKTKLNQFKSPEKAKLASRFFKTGKGQYGEGDIFIGIMSPDCRKIAKEFQDLSMGEIEKLLHSKIHEERTIALMILVNKFVKASAEIKKEIFDFYLSNTSYINNWDLVDLSSRDIVGVYLEDKDRSILLKLAHSKSIWERRIAIISTYHFLKAQKQADWTFKIAEALLNDSHDLIQKAVGWMLREVEKNISKETEEEFLKKHYQQMPRTMLRYAIEHFDPKQRTFYLSKKQML